MLKKITLIALSLALLFYPVGLPQAHSLSGLQTGEESMGTQTPTLSIATDISKGKESVQPPSARKTNTPLVEKTDSAIGNSTTSPSKGLDNRSGRRPNAKANGSSFNREKKAHGTKPLAVTSHNAALPNGRRARNEILIRTINANYIARTGKSLVLTSGNRTPAGQARAINSNLRLYGSNYVLSLYRRKAAIREVVNAYKLNRRRPRRALVAMTRVIEAQVGRGVIISKHMLGRAFDVRSRGPNGARLSVLREVVKEMGGRVLVERNHYHVEI